MGEKLYFYFYHITLTCTWYYNYDTRIHKLEKRRKQRTRFHLYAQLEHNYTFYYFLGCLFSWEFFSRWENDVCFSLKYLWQKSKSIMHEK